MWPGEGVPQNVICPVSWLIGPALGLLAAEPGTLMSHPFILPSCPHHQRQLVRFLRDSGGQPLVVPVHQHSTAGPADVRHLGQRAWRGRARPPAAPHSHPVCQPGVGAGAALSQYPRTQALPHHGARGGRRCAAAGSPALEGGTGWAVLEPRPPWKGSFETFPARGRSEDRVWGPQVQVKEGSP